MTTSTSVAEPCLQPDTELMHAFCGGDLSAFDSLYWRHHKPLVDRLYAVCGDVHLAEDAAQEAWHAVVAGRASYNPPENSNFSGWLYAIGYRKAISAWRHFRREKTCLPVEWQASSGPDLGDGPVRELIRSEDAELLRGAIDELPDHYRMTVVLYYFEEYDASTIADVLEIAETTVYSRLHAARKRLLGLVVKPAR